MKEDASKSKIKLDLYIHHYKFYDTHRSSLKYAKQFDETLEQHLETLRTQFKLSHIDTTFFKSAAQTLIANRHALQYSYVFAYDMATKGSANSLQIFKDNLDNLHQITERLSSLLENETGYSVRPKQKGRGKKRQYRDAFGVNWLE